MRRWRHPTSRDLWLPAPSERLVASHFRPISLRTMKASKGPKVQGWASRGFPKTVGASLEGGWLDAGLCFPMYGRVREGPGGALNVHSP